MKNLEQFVRDFFVKEYDNMIEYNMNNISCYYNKNTESWEIPRELEQFINENCKTEGEKIDIF